MKNTTRNTLLVTVATAALLLGAGLAFAQDTKENRAEPGATTHDQKAPSGKMDQHPDSVRQKSPAPTAQAPMKEEKPAVNAKAPTVSKPETKGPGSNGQTSKSPNPHGSPTAARDETKSGPPTTLSAEQHAKIRDTLRGEKAEHLTNVPFLTTVGGPFQEQFIFTFCLYRSRNMPRNIATMNTSWSAMKFSSSIPGR